MNLFLHVCCGACEAGVLSQLGDAYKLACFFYNPNIHPEDEFVRRKADAQKISQLFSVDFIAEPWTPLVWENAVGSVTHTPEGGARCEVCIKERMRKTAEKCAEMGYARFTSTLSISPHKNIDTIHRAGEEASQRHGVTYEPYNFKKNDGFKKSVELSRQYGLYRQNYCGCRLSRRERERQ